MSDAAFEADAFNSEMAAAAAAYAHSAYFSSRRGVLPSDGHLVVCYDNNPFGADDALPDDDLRAGILARLVEAVGAKGVELLARASAGDDGYTVALVFKVPNGDTQAPTEKLIVREWQRLVVEALQVEAPALTLSK